MEIEQRYLGSDALLINVITFCLVDSEVPGFALQPLPLAWVSPKFRLIYCKILLFKKWLLNNFNF